MIKTLLWILKKKKLSVESRALILNALLEHVNDLPIKDIITYGIDGTIIVNGKTLDVEQSIVLRDGAKAIQDNQTYKLIKDQVTYEAIKMGVHSAVSLEMTLMSKAAIWVQEQEKRLINELSGEVV